MKYLKYIIIILIVCDPIFIMYKVLNVLDDTLPIQANINLGFRWVCSNCGYFLDDSEIITNRIIFESRGTIFLLNKETAIFYINESQPQFNKEKNILTDNHGEVVIGRSLDPNDSLPRRVYFKDKNILVHTNTSDLVSQIQNI